MGTLPDDEDEDDDDDDDDDANEDEILTPSILPSFSKPPPCFCPISVGNDF